QSPAGPPVLPLLLPEHGAGSPGLLLGDESMVQLAGGTFQMGFSSPEKRNEEGPVREVTVKPFAVDKYPVTNRDFSQHFHTAVTAEKHPLGQKQGEIIQQYVTFFCILGTFN
uniref:Sulfatase-modifying factor enzyme-like domain-containing protein n=1 Tax=Strix occidentalis caurina TaxID=311401 RepID=A0A8D0KTH3_STROC